MGEILRTLALFAAFGAYLAFLLLFQSAPGKRSKVGQALTVVLVTWLLDRAMLILFTAAAMLYRSPPLWVWAMPDYLVAIAAIGLLVEATGARELLQQKVREVRNGERDSERNI